ncbi:MAG: TetR/AcrR family transcriptional regulator [Deltaproteobacteria bacterium]|nr:TetR/AcrR family transcriptional regulator [Deltaproteobacteria bacterium]
MRVTKKHDARLGEILDAAETLFIQKGYDAAAANDILGKVEIGKGAFYHYFKSKEDAMASVIVGALLVGVFLRRMSIKTLRRWILGIAVRNNKLFNSPQCGR